MKTSRLSYGFLVAFIVTIGAERWYPPSENTLIVLGIFLAAMSIIFFMQSRKSAAGKNARSCAMGCAMAVAIVLGIGVASIVVQHSMHITTPHDIEYYASDTAVTVHGRIVDTPDIRPTVAKYTLSADFLIEKNGEKIPVLGRVLINDTGGWPEYVYGDILLATGKLQRPIPIDDFAYDKYLSVSHIYSILPRAQVTVAGDNGYKKTNAIGWLLKGIYGLRTQFEHQINRLLPEPHASLLAGLLTGSRRGIPTHLTDDFRRAGITHIIAISGYNVTIILSLLSGMLLWLPLKKRFGFLIIGIILFTIFVGASASVVRAAIMGVLGLLALQTERQTTMRLSILWTAFVMLCWNPLYLWYDAGFQLSFLAVIGIAEFSDPLKKLFRHVPETLALRESLVATMAAQIATLPLTIILFKQISLVASLTNLLVAPLIPIAMMFGFFATIIGSMWTPLGLMIAYLDWGLLQAIILIAETCAHLPLAVITW